MPRIRFGTGIVLSLTLVTLAGCGFIADAALSSMEKVSDKEAAKALDESIAAAVAGGNEGGEVAVPMSEFFGDTQKYKLWAGDPAAFKALGEKCIAAGAPAAYALVTKDDQLKMASSFAITLPEDKTARAKVIEVYNQCWKDFFKLPKTSPNASEDEKEEAEMMKEELEYYLAKDLGQKYLYFDYDD